MGEIESFRGKNRPPRDVRQLRSPARSRRASRPPCPGHVPRCGRARGVSRRYSRLGGPREGGGPRGRLLPMRHAAGHDREARGRGPRVATCACGAAVAAFAVDGAGCHGRPRGPRLRGRAFAPARASAGPRCAQRTPGIGAHVAARGTTLRGGRVVTASAGGSWARRSERPDAFGEGADEAGSTPAASRWELAEKGGICGAAGATGRQHRSGSLAARGGVAPCSRGKRDGCTVGC